MLNWSVIFELDFACWWQFEKCIWLVWLDEITQPGISTWDNLLHLEESKLQHNFLGIGFQLAGAHNGYGILSTQGNFSLLKCDIASTKLKSWLGVAGQVFKTSFQLFDSVLLWDIQQASELAHKGFGCIGLDEAFHLRERFKWNLRQVLMIAFSLAEWKLVFSTAITNTYIVYFSFLD